MAILSPSHLFPPNFEIFFLSPFSPVSQLVWAWGLPWLWLTSQESHLKETDSSACSFQCHWHLSAWQGLMPTSLSSCCDFVCLELAQVLCTLSQWLWVHKCHVLLCLENTFVGVTATIGCYSLSTVMDALGCPLPITGMNCNPHLRSRSQGRKTTSFDSDLEEEGTPLTWATASVGSLY